ncbi:MAG: hypothetical protein DSY59_01765 [Persephonella sp.]|nr:MAG: hypothetical protein DSY59_01765 [Persephonella sp.]
MRITKIIKHIQEELNNKFNLKQNISLKEVFEDLDKVSDGFFKDIENRKYLNLDKKFLNNYLYKKGNPIRSFDTVIIDSKNRLCCIEFKNISSKKLEEIKQELKEKVGDTLLLFFALNLNNLNNIIFHKPNMIIIYNENKSKDKFKNQYIKRVIDHSLKKYKPFCSGIKIISNKELSNLKDIPETQSWEDIFIYNK